MSTSAPLGRGRPRSPRRGGPILDRLVCGLIAGLVGAATVRLAGDAAGVPRRPTLPALMVAKAVRTPGISRRQRGTGRRTASTMLGMERPGGPDLMRAERVGTIAHYLWGAIWGAVRVGLDSRSGAISATLTHFLLFTVTDHVLLAATHVGTPIWAPHPEPGVGNQQESRRGPRRDAALQLTQLIVYVAATNYVYTTLRPPIAACSPTHGQRRPE